MTWEFVCGLITGASLVQTVYALIDIWQSVRRIRRLWAEIRARDEKRIDAALASAPATARKAKR